MKAQIKWVEKRTFLGVSGSGFTLPFGTASGKDGLKGSLGVEHDISHTIDRLEPTGISGLTTVNLERIRFSPGHIRRQRSNLRIRFLGTDRWPVR